MSNLDDFFKKRDKKKKTTNKSKFVTLDTEVLAKNLEVAAIISDAENDSEFTEKPDRPPTSENLDEEWKPFDSEENRDYSGLRINTQTWKDEDEEFESRQGVVDENSGKAAWAPWGSSKNKSSKDDDEDKDDEDEETNTAPAEPKSLAAVIAENNTPVAPVETKAEPVAATPSAGAYIPPSMRARMAAEAASKPAEAAPAPKPASSGAYVPPSMRGRMGDESGSSNSGGGYDIPTSSVNYRRPNKSQPNLNDCLEFPTLGNDDGGSGTTGTDERFEFSKKAGRVEPKNEKDSQIHIQNKFATLSSNQ